MEEELINSPWHYQAQCYHYVCDLLIFAVITGLIIIATKCPRYKVDYSPPMQQITEEANKMVLQFSFIVLTTCYTFITH